MELPSWGYADFATLQQEVPGQRREQLAEPVAFRVPDLVAEIGRAQFVSLVADDQIPVGPLNFGLGIFVPAEHVEAADGQGDFVEPVAGPCRLQGVVGHDLERQEEFAVELVLPLFDQVSRADDETAFPIAAGDQLFDEQAGHNRFACAGIFGEQETNRLSGEHLLVNCRDLVGEGFNQQGMDGEQRIEQVSLADAVGLRNEAEKRAVAIEAPGAADLDDFQGRLAVAVEQLDAQAAVAVFVGHLNGDSANPADVNDGDQSIGQDPFDRCAVGDFFKWSHRFRPRSLEMDFSKACSTT